MRNVSVVGMRVRDGDDASCLNLNRAQQPRLLAVDPEEFQGRRAFAGEWALLNQSQENGAVPAIGDEATVRWALEESRRHNRVCRRARKFVPASDRWHHPELSSARQSRHLREQLRRAISV